MPEGSTIAFASDHRLLSSWAHESPPSCRKKPWTVGDAPDGQATPAASSLTSCSSTGMSRKATRGGEIACHVTGPTRVPSVGSEHECFAFWISRAASGAWVAEGSNWCTAGGVNDDLCGRDDILAHDALPGRPNRPVGVTWGGCIHAITSAFNNRKKMWKLDWFRSGCGWDY